MRSDRELAKMAAIPGAVALVLVREPVSRLQSYFNEKSLSRAKFAAEIDHWAWHHKDDEIQQYEAIYTAAVTHFSRERVVVVDAGDLTTQDKLDSIMSKITQTAGLPVKQYHVIHANKNKLDHSQVRKFSATLSTSMTIQLRNYFKDKNEKFFERIGRNLGWNEGYSNPLSGAKTNVTLKDAAISASDPTIQHHHEEEEEEEEEEGDDDEEQEVNERNAFVLIPEQMVVGVDADQEGVRVKRQTRLDLTAARSTAVTNTDRAALGLKSFNIFEEGLTAVDRIDRAMAILIGTGTAAAIVRLCCSTRKRWGAGIEGLSRRCFRTIYQQRI